MFDHLPLEQIRDASEQAMARIAFNTNRIAELDDDELSAVALHVKTTRPLMEAALISLCGDEAKANAELQRVMSYSQGKLVKLVRRGQEAMQTHRNPTLRQFAAYVLDVQIGCAAVQVEQEKRAAKLAGRMN